jgi:MFS family permease
MHNSLSRTEVRFVWTMSLLQLISWGSGFYAFALFMGPVEEALHISRAQSSVGFSLALLAEGLLAFPVGRWIDRGRERWVMVGGSVLMGLAFVAHSAVNHLWQFYAVWTLLGVGLAGTLYPPAFAVLARRFPQHFRRTIIVVTFLGGLASTVFIPLVAWLIDAFGWRYALLALAAMHLLLCAPLHAYLLRDAKSAPAQIAPATTHSHATGLWHFMRQPAFWQLGLFVVLLMGVASALPAHMVSLLRESGLHEAWALAVPAAIGVFQVLGRLGLYFFEHRIDVHRTNRWVPFLIPLSFTTLLIGQGQVAWALAFVAFYGIGNGTLTIVKGTVMAQYVSREHMGALNGALGLPIALARAASPLIMGLLWSADQGYRQGLWLMLAVSLAGVGALWAAQRHHRNP